MLVVMVGVGGLGRQGSLWQPASICNQRQMRNFSDVAFPLVCHQKAEDPKERLKDFPS